MSSFIQVVDFGGQYTQLIARRLREMGVYCEIVPHFKYDSIPSNVSGIILSGGPRSVGEEEAPVLPLCLAITALPVLGICYGMQLLASRFSGQVASGTPEYGSTGVNIELQSELFQGLPNSFKVWMSHGDSVIDPGSLFRTTAFTDRGVIASIEGVGSHSNYFGVQFHPEVIHTEFGFTFLKNFVRKTGVDSSYSPHQALDRAKAYVKETVDGGAVICGLSGGVDSVVTAKIIDSVIGKKLYCVYVDNGLMREGETDELKEAFRGLFSNPVTFVDASRSFLSHLEGVRDPETKRKIIGKLFVQSFDDIVHFIKDISGPIEYLAQGTLYPDIIESVPVYGSSQVIKSHHNVGGLPEHMKLKLVEPLRYLFKDEVKEIGRVLNVPEAFLSRQPFPGPALAIRVVGEFTSQRLHKVRAADKIVREEIKTHSLDSFWQVFPAILPVQTVGVMGDGRTYDEMITIRAVKSTDGMTADVYYPPNSFLSRVSSRIINEVKGINRVVFDITSKPPGTIEYE
jgi:GMP synthase (glutamine-hydrolysing)